MKELCWLDAVELAELIREKAVSPVEVMSSCLGRISSINPRVNAVVTLEEEEALQRQAALAEEQVMAGAESQGVLHGVPLLVKDNVYTRGMRTTMGSKLYEQFVPAEDAVLVERLKAAGAIVIGKSNLSEFGLLPVTDNILFGSTQNPWDLQRTSGGSSGGSAAAVAVGLVPISTGNDAGGSIRVPASFCGVYGIKPSFGRVPCYPKMPGWENLVHEGPITRSVVDAALMLEVMAGPDERDRYSLPASNNDYLTALEDEVKGMKVACCTDLGYTRVDPRVKDTVRSAARIFEKLGAYVEEIVLDLPDMMDVLQAITIVDAVTANEDRLEEWKQLCYPRFRGIFEQADTYTARDMARMDFQKENLWAGLRGVFENFDILLTPTTPVTAFPFVSGGEVGPGEIDGQKVRSLSCLAFTDLFNFTGQPAASIPCGFDSNGLPVGLQVVGRRYDEHAVFKISAAFEQVCPWKEGLKEMFK